MTRTLVITNDFPPRVGGIQSFVHSLASQFPPDELVVYGPKWEGAPEFDAAQRFPVVRHPTTLMLPTPDVLRRARGIAAEYACDAVWFGAAAPLGLLAAPLRRDPGVRRIVASTHGHEVGWAKLPRRGSCLRRIGHDCDTVTYLGDYTLRRLSAACGPAPRFAQLPSGVDTEAFSPDAPGAEIRQRYGLTDRPVVVCVSRLVARKGQDILIQALPAIRRRVPDTALLLVGGGPYRERLERQAQEAGLERDVVFTGSVPSEELPAHYAAGDVFAMPCRSRLRWPRGRGARHRLSGGQRLWPARRGRKQRRGAGRGASKGRPGHVVDGRDVDAVVGRVIALLATTRSASAMGQAGREWVSEEWQLAHHGGPLARLAAGLASASRGRRTGALSGRARRPRPSNSFITTAAFELERRRELATLLGEIDRQDRRTSDGLGLADRFVGIVDRRLHGSPEVRDRRRAPTAVCLRACCCA